MGWRNPPVPWSELEQKLSGRPTVGRAPSGRPDAWAPGDGGDSPAWSRSRNAYEPPAIEPAEPAGPTVPYAELHCHSNFSFSNGASAPEELVQEAVRLGLEALAITDCNGFYGVVRFAEAARAHGLPTVFGAELSLEASTISGLGGLGGLGGAGGAGDLVVLARGPTGYAELARAISLAQLAGSKGAPRLRLDELANQAATTARDQWVALTGTSTGAVTRALMADGPAAARRELDALIDSFGQPNVFVEIWDHGHPLDSARNDELVRLAAATGVDIVAANDVRYHAPVRRRLATALAAVAERESLDGVNGSLPAAAMAHLRSGHEQQRWFARYPGVVERAAEVARACAFDLSLVAPSLPPFPCPGGHDEMSWLRHLTEERAVRFYGTRANEHVPGAWHQIDHELNTIEHLGFPGYFLVVFDIVEFCRRNDIYCQGRGSAANSAVCFALGITKADAVSLGLLFERFLSPERDGPPDIDIDIESGRREEVIQYVYDRYGRHHAAQVANVITYRARSSVRDMARSLGYAPGQQDAFSKNLSRWSGLADQDELDVPADVLELAAQLEDAPRHLGIHSGGMVICDRPIIEVCPVEWARMADRSVLQWDKEDCAAVGLVKFDLLGLGMLSALHLAVDLITDYYGIELDLATIPQQDCVYDMLCKADSIGVFQVESRAQMATLPRLKPRTFYDLVVEVALIRPGPIQGGSVHPYIRRRNGQEPVSYLHPLLENALSKTLGIPLFQEQLMQMAIDVAGFSAAEADELRQAMGSKRSQQRMERLRQRFYDGMAERGITGSVADQIWDKLAAFANFGFPESHSVSFAYLVYSSAWIKHHYPAAFCASLLNAQPMGFYSPHTLVQDARRHGVTVLHPCINRSAAGASLISPGSAVSPGSALPRPFRHSPDPPEGHGRPPSAVALQVSPGSALPRPFRHSPDPPEGHGRPPSAVALQVSPGSAPFAGNLLTNRVSAEPKLADPPEGRGDKLDPPPLLLQGLSSVRHVGEELAEDIVAERERGGEFESIEAVRRRTGIDRRILESLATAGAFDGLGVDRRQALWTAGAVASTGAQQLEGIVTGTDAPQLPGMSDRETAHANLWATGVAADGHPTRFIRSRLDDEGVVVASSLLTHPHTKVVIAGVVTHRQRPATAGGTTFLNIEDETGLINVVVSKGCWLRHRTVAGTAPALYVHGRLERNEGVVNVIAERLLRLPLETKIASRDFR